MDLLLLTFNTQQQDCLYLNIYAPATVTSTSRLPVLLFIYGGSFTSGAATIPIYDGSVVSHNCMSIEHLKHAPHDTTTKIAGLKNDTIVVTTNYRLGALGFSAFPGYFHWPMV